MKDKPVRHHRELRIMVKGSRDLLQVQNYLSSGAQFDSEVSSVSQNGYRMNVSHTEILRRCNQYTLKNYGAIIDMIHFLDRNAFRTRFFGNDHHVYIYSVLDNYTKGLYRYRNSDFIIPFGDFTSDLTDQQTWDYHSKRSEKHRLKISFLTWFKNNFTFLGPLQTDAFKQNIVWLCSNMHPNRLLIIINGSEVAYPYDPESNRWERHKEMNQALHDTVSHLPHVALCDVRDFARTPEDHLHNIRSYSRKVYFQIAQRIHEIIEEHFCISRGFWEKRKLKIKYHLQLSRKSEKRQAFRSSLKSYNTMALPNYTFNTE